MRSLSDAIVAAVDVLSPDHVARLVQRYRGAVGYSQIGASAVRFGLPAPYRPVADRINAEWSALPSLAGDAIALALDAASAALGVGQGSRVEVVVTGPPSAAPPVRLTPAVVSQMIDRAVSRVTIVSFAAYQIDAVVEALAGAISRGVAVRLILESPEKLAADGPAGTGAGRYSRAGVGLFHWPAASREPPGAKFHAKAVIVDGHDLLLSSTNMAATGYDKNIEIGVLCRGGPLAAQVQRHFDSLIERGVLTSAVGTGRD